MATQLVKPWVSVAALYVSFKAPQPCRQAMLAGLTPSIGGAAARGLFYGRAGMRRLGWSGRWRRATDSDRGSVKVRHPTYKHLEGRLRLGAFTLGQWAQITAGTAAAVFGAYLSPLPTRVTIFVAILGAAGLPVAVSYGAMGLEFSIGQLSPPRGATGGCRAATRPAPAAPRPATDCCPSRMNPSVQSRRRRSCGTREARRGAGRGRSVSGRGARSRGAGGHQRGRAGPRAARRAEEPARDVHAEREQVGHALGQLAGRLPAGQSLQFYVEATPVGLDALLERSETDAHQAIQAQGCRRRPAAALRRLHAAMRESMERHADEQAAVELAYYVIVPYLPDQRPQVDWRRLCAAAPPAGTAALERSLAAHRRARASRCI